MEVPADAVWAVVRAGLDDEVVDRGVVDVVIEGGIKNGSCDTSVGGFWAVLSREFGTPPLHDPEVLVGHGRLVPRVVTAAVVGVAGAGSRTCLVAGFRHDRQRRDIWGVRSPIWPGRSRDALSELSGGELGLATAASRATAKVNGQGQVKGHGASTRERGRAVRGGGHFGPLRARSAPVPSSSIVGASGPLRQVRRQAPVAPGRRGSRPGGCSLDRLTPPLVAMTVGHAPDLRPCARPDGRRPSRDDSVTTTGHVRSVAAPHAAPDLRRAGSPRGRGRGRTPFSPRFAGCVTVRDQREERRAEREAMATGARCRAHGDRPGRLRRRRGLCRGVGPAPQRGGQAALRGVRLAPFSAHGGGSGQPKSV